MWNGTMADSSIKDARKLDKCIQKHAVGSISQTIYKVNSQWIKYWDYI